MGKLNEYYLEPTVYNYTFNISVWTSLKNSLQKKAVIYEKYLFGCPHSSISNIRFAINAVQPVWCEAPSPWPVSPWKYSKNC